MDVMDARRRLLMIGGLSSLVGIKQVEVVVSTSGTTLTIPVPEKPWGFLLACDNDGVAGRNTTTRASAIWSNYNGGNYVGGRYAITRGNGSPDHYAFPTGSPVYDDQAKTLTLNTTSGYFTSGDKYYLWYFTIPF